MLCLSLKIILKADVINPVLIALSDVPIDENSSSVNISLGFLNAIQTIELFKYSQNLYIEVSSDVRYN